MNPDVVGIEITQEDDSEGKGKKSKKKKKKKDKKKEKEEKDEKEENDEKDEKDEEEKDEKSYTEEEKKLIKIYKKGMHLLRKAIRSYKKRHRNEPKIELEIHFKKWKDIIDSLKKKRRKSLKMKIIKLKI